MKKIIKKTPISLGGVDFYEVLIEDDSIVNDCPCQLCLYSDFPYFDIDSLASCCDIHGCTMKADRYFILEPILTK